MAVSPSSVDQEHILDYIQEVDWFIRGIYNKKGEEKVDVFDKRVMLTYQSVETDIYEYAQTDDWYQALDLIIEQNVQRQKPAQYATGRSYAAGHMLPYANYRTPPFIADKKRADYMDDEEFEELLKDPFYTSGP
jgi:hypothetical protein